MDENKFKEKLDKFVSTLNDKEVDTFLEMLGEDTNEEKIEKKKAYIVEALPGNKTRIIEDDA